MRAPPTSTRFPYPPLFRSIVTDALELRAIAPDPAAAGLVVIATLSDDRKAYFLPAAAGPLATDLDAWLAAREHDGWLPALRADRKSTRLNSSHLGISYAVF